MMLNQEPDYDEIEALFVNNEKLDRITTHLRRFNPIRVMKMERQEIRHSAILAWLLDPKETHGLDDRFLKSFLGEALRGQSALGPPTALDVSLSDMRDTEVRPEWNNIDILIQSARNKWSFIVENKFYSSQHSDQLARYSQKAKANLDQGAIIRGIFLSLLDEEPHDDSYVTLKYDSICELLSRLIEQDRKTLGREILIFLEHYLEIIREEAGMSKEQNEIVNLAREIYRTHKRVLDFIVEHGSSTEFIIACESLFGENKGLGDTVDVGENSYYLFGRNNFQSSFLPLSWYQTFGSKGYIWRGCEKWWAGYPLICWFQLIPEKDGAKGKLKLFAEVGPISDQGFRAEIVKEIGSLGSGVSKVNIQFQRGASDEGRRYSKFLKDNAESVADIHDAENISNAMKKLLTKFQPCFDAVAPVLSGFVKYGAQDND